MICNEDDGNEILQISRSEGVASASTSNEHSVEAIEEILQSLRGNGRYQTLVIWLIMLPSFFGLSFIQSLVYFVIPIPDDYWCKIPGLDPRVPVAAQLSLLPVSLEDPTKHSQCQLYDLDYHNLLGPAHDNVTAILRYLNSSGDELSVTACKSGWDYDRSTYESTIVTEFNLVCGRTFLPTLAYILTSVGGGFGIAFGGYLSDNIGRKKTYFLALIIILSFGVASAFSPSYEIYVVLTALLATGTNSFYQVPYTIGVEILAPEARSSYSVALTVAFAAGGLGVTGLAYGLRSWRLLTIVGTAPFAVFLLYWFFMPESPRWLLVQGEFVELYKTLNIMAHVNGTGKVLEQWIEPLKALCSSNSDGKPRSWTGSIKISSWTNLFRRPGMRRQTLLLTYLSSTVQICYGGLNFYAPTLGDDPYLAFFLSSLIELPGSLLTGLVADRFGRRLTTIICFTGSCVACFGIVGMQNTYWGLLTIFLVAKMFVTSSYITQELILYEVFPTEIRAEGVAFVNTVAYISSNLGPVIVYLRFDNPILPFVVFGVICVVGIVCVLFIPETHNAPLPESTAECERRGRKVELKTLFDFSLRNRGRLVERPTEICLVEEVRL